MPRSIATWGKLKKKLQIQYKLLWNAHYFTACSSTPGVHGKTNLFIHCAQICSSRKSAKPPQNFFWSLAGRAPDVRDFVAQDFFCCCKMKAKNANRITGCCFNSFETSMTNLHSPNMPFVQELLIWIMDFCGFANIAYLTKSLMTSVSEFNDTLFLGPVTSETWLSGCILLCHSQISKNWFFRPSPFWNREPLLKRRKTWIFSQSFYSSFFFAHFCRHRTYKGH